MALLTQKRAILGDLCQNMALAPAKTPTVQRCQHKKGVFLVFSHDGTKKIGW